MSYKQGRTVFIAKLLCKESWRNIRGEQQPSARLVSVLWFVTLHRRSLASHSTQLRTHEGQRHTERVHLCSLYVAHIWIPFKVASIFSLVLFLGPALQSCPLDTLLLGLVDLFFVCSSFLIIFYSTNHPNPSGKALLGYLWQSAPAGRCCNCTIWHLSPLTAIQKDPCIYFHFYFYN